MTCVLTTNNTGKMVIVRLWNVFFILFNAVTKIFATTHWVVTENGRIQSQLDSPFYLRRPYDLLALLNQETRRKDINTLYNDLVARKNSIDQKWSGLEGATELENRVHSQDPHCLSAVRKLSDTDLYPSIFANGTEREGVVIRLTCQNDIKGNVLAPDCKKYYKLDFSMFTFEHLPGMVNRSNINITPELGLKKMMPFSSVKQFGHEIAIELSKNSSSWIHYNLAMLYWRIKGNAQKGIECGRRAVYFAGREYRDIPLLNLANIFHQGRHSRDAAIILHAAVDHAPQEPIHYQALGNVYAVLAEYNRSISCYENVLKLRPTVRDVSHAKSAVLCHQRLESELMELHKSLQEILSDLHDYHSQQQQWVRLQERLLWEQAPFEVQLAGYSSEKLAEIMTRRGQRCVQRNSDESKNTITCDFTDDHLATNLQVDITLSLQRLLRNVESETLKITQQMWRGKGEEQRVVQQNVIEPLKEKIREVPSVEAKVRQEEGLNAPPILHQKYPASLASSANQYFDVTGWPKKEECVDWDLPVTEPDELDLPVFLPPENKGYQVNKMLTDYIDLPASKEHDLPWYPPVCDFPEDLEDKSHRPISLKQMENTQIKVNDHIRRHLLKYLNKEKWEEAEIGQRIITAMHKKAGPDWVLATLASLYWRVRGSTRKALNCLEVAFQTVPKDYTDVILVSYGSLLYQHRLIDDAIKFATLAYKLNDVEPSTNFLLGLLHYSKNNPIMAMHYMKNVLRVDAFYYDGRAETLLKTWACRLKLGNYEDIDGSKTDSAICGEKGGLSVDGVICSAKGGQCKTATIQCVRADNIKEGAGTLAGMLSDKDCNKFKPVKKQSVISKLVTSEGSGGVEPDQSQLERMVEHKQFHMKFRIGEEFISDENGEFDETMKPTTLHVYDKTGTYPLSPSSCKKIMDTDWLQFPSMLQAYGSRNIDISSLLKPLPKHLKLDVKPYCSLSLPDQHGIIDRLTKIVLRHRLPSKPETHLFHWIALMAGDKSSSLRELAAKIGSALKDNTTSWILATAAALYWRVMGNTGQAMTCLRQALFFVPNEMKDIPLISLASVLQRIGYHADALEVAYMALDSHPNYVLNHFTVGNVHTAMGELEKAISFYRSSLEVDANFEPARNRLQTILCMLLFDENGTLREMPAN